MELNTQAHDELISKYRDELSTEDFESAMEEHTGNCPICNPDNQNNPDEGGDMETFTKDELDSAVNAAVAPLQAELESTKAELTSIKSDLAEDEVASRVAEATADSEARITELQDQLDTAVNDAATARAELAELEQFLADEAEKLELIALFNDRKEARLAEIAEKLPHMPQERIDARIDEWTEKSDDDWASFLEDLVTIPAAKDDAEEDEQETVVTDSASLLSTALTTTRSDGAGTGNAISTVLSTARFAAK